MSNTVFCHKIRLVCAKDALHGVLKTLRRMGIQSVHHETNRSVMLDERRGLRALLSGQQALREDQTAVLTFLVESPRARECVNCLVAVLGLDMPGQGSITARKVELLEGTGEVFDPLIIPSGPRVISDNLTGICCIVQMGEGNTMGTIGLSTGTAVPSINYGLGTGLRNRLGVWRIFIPAEKEVVQMALDSQEAHTVMDMMIDAGHLDQPGKGFIYLYPIEMGVLETRFSCAETRQAASIEQIVSAIDEIKGTTQWRRKSVVEGQSSSVSRSYLTDLVECTVLCNEGYAEDLTKAAMAAGAGGATLRRCKYIPLGDDLSSRAGSGNPVSPARELSSMSIGRSMVPAIIKALEDKGLRDPATSGEIQLAPVQKAFTFLGK